MAKNQIQRKNIIVASQRLFRRHGYAATGINDIVRQSGAPRGSLYYYFPDGKEDIATSAIEAAGKMVERTLSGIAQTATDPVDFIETYAGMLEHWMALSGYRDGCPITTILLETAPRSKTITEAGQKAFNAWRQIIRELLQAHDIPENRSAAMANMILSTLEGALILARVDASAQPIRDAVKELTWYLLCQCNEQA